MPYELDQIIEAAIVAVSGLFLLCSRVHQTSFVALDCSTNNRLIMMILYEAKTAHFLTRHLNIIVLQCDYDLSCFQVYTITITREQIPVAVAFGDVNDQMQFECPVSLNALYRPVSINLSR